MAAPLAAVAVAALALALPATLAVPAITAAVATAMPFAMSFVVIGARTSRVPVRAPRPARPTGPEAMVG